MRYLYFDIKNFKGIEKVRVNIDKSPKINIFTLVGLNESGKTTILDAINYLGLSIKGNNAEETLNYLSLQGYCVEDVHELIPISDRDNFNKTISVSAGLALDDDDENQIATFLKKNHNITVEERIKTLTIERKLHFKSSNLDTDKKVINYWTISLKIKRPKAKKVIKLSPPEKEWFDTIYFIRDNLIPPILYFPNFLFDFPSKIYLENYEGVSKSNSFYLLVIQDILDALGTGTNVNDHILNRSKSKNISDEKSLESLLLNMGRHVTKTIFGAWSKIFKRAITNKEIVIQCKKEDGDKFFLEFKLKDIDGFYLVTQRSLGFRWFFVFLLMTQYRGFRKDGPKNLIFLFDEPASNLHPSAQGQLLSSLDRLTENAKVIYTTHSHHLINPKWLEGTFVVINEGMDYKDDIENYSASKTRVMIDSYWSFASKHPNQISYFQPILDILDYSPTNLDPIPRVIMLEGKNDFFTLSYFSEVIFDGKYSLHFVPVISASNLDPVIMLYVGWGLSFLVLLDSDKEGKTQKNRYTNMFGPVVDEKIVTLSDIKPEWKNSAMEKLFEKSDLLALQIASYPETSKFHKTHFNRAIQEHLVTKKLFNFSELTKQNFMTLLERLSEELNKI